MTSPDEQCDAVALLDPESVSLPTDIRTDVPGDVERYRGPWYPDGGQQCVEESVDELQDVLILPIVIFVDHEFMDPVIPEDDGEDALLDGAGYVEQLTSRTRLHLSSHPPNLCPQERFHRSSSENLL